MRDAVAADLDLVLGDLARWVAHDSPSGAGVELDALAAELASTLSGYGLACELVPSPAGLHVHASLEGAGRARVALLCHHDTVFPLGTAARRPLRREGDRLIGPGVADMKGGLAVAAHAARVLAATRDVTIDDTSGDGEISFVGDDRLLRQMVSNLIDNAIRHATRGGTVGVSLRASKCEATIRVSDNGRGIPESQRERIFERFARHEPDYGGAGLGLAIARWIAEAHDGRLVLESTGPSGSVFAVSLPMDERR